MVRSQRLEGLGKTKNLSIKENKPIKRRCTIIIRLKRSLHFLLHFLCLSILLFRVLLAPLDSNQAVEEE